MAAPPPLERGGQLVITRRRLLWPILPAATAGVALGGVVLISGCDNNSPTPAAALDSLSEILGQAFELPPAPPIERGIIIKETIQKPAGHVVGEIVRAGRVGEFGEDIKIAVYHVDGDGRKRLLNKDAADPTVDCYDFSLSPDGQTVALASIQKGKGPWVFGVKIVDVASGQEKRALEKNSPSINDLPAALGASGRSDDFRWSPDSRYLSYAPFATIWDAESGRMAYQTPGTHFLPRYLGYNQNLFVWSPTEDRVFITPNRTVEMEINEQYPPSHIVDFTTGEDKVLANFGDNSAAWSENGEMIVISTPAKNAKQEVIVSLFDKRGKWIKDLDFSGYGFGLPQAYIDNLIWSPNGQHLAFFIHQTSPYDRPSTHDLAIFDVTSGKKVIIPTEGKLVFMDNKILYMLAPSTDSQATHIVSFSLADNKLVDSQAIELGVGRVGSLSPQPDGSVVIGIERPKTQGSSGDPNPQLYRLDIGSRKLTLVGRGVKAMIGRTETIEQEVGVAQEGDVVETEGRAYRLMGGNKHEIPGPFLLWRQRSGHTGKYIQAGAGALRDIPEGKIAVGRDGRVVDPSGRVTRYTGQGAVKPAFYAGLLTGEKPGEFYVPLEEEGTFAVVRSLLRQLGYTDEDILLFSYSPDWRGKTGSEYPFAATMQDPAITIRVGNEQATAWDRTYPLENRVIICHSLGGIAGLFALEGHMATTKAIIFIDCPILGLPQITDQKIRESILELEGENVYRFLLRAGRSEDYMRRVDKIVRGAMDRGIGVYTLANRSDRIVPWQSAFIPWANDTVDGRLIERAFNMGESNMLGHGDPLGHPQVLEYIGRILGRNLAVG